MKVLLTGAVGFVGQAVHDALGQAGHEVVAVDLMIAQAHGQDAPTPDGVHRLDVRSADQHPLWARLLDGVDAVCHQAAVVGVENSTSDLPAYAAHNDLGTAALLAAMDRVGTRRLVLASSMVVYGEGGYACADHGPQRPGDRSSDALAEGRFDHPCPVCGEPLGWLPVDEDAPLQPRSGYAASKAAQEHYASAWAALCGGRVTALRYHNVYGPGMPADSSYCGVAALFRSAVGRGQSPQVYEDGAQARDFVHVRDVARANLIALDALGTGAGPSVGSLRPYNVASGQPITIAQVAAAICGPGLEPRLTGGFRAGDVRHVVASAARARTELGFSAEVPPGVGLADLANAPLRPTGGRR